MLGLPGLMERRRTLEDWVEVHRHNIEQALFSAVNASKTPVDYKKQYAVFDLSYRRGSEGDPSTGFIVNSASIVNDPTPSNSPQSVNLQTFRLTMVEADAEMAREDPGYMGAFPTICQSSVFFNPFNFLLINSI